MFCADTWDIKVRRDNDNGVVVRLRSRSCLADFVFTFYSGYRWGKSGKVYKTKAEAEKQGRAIRAAGYKGKK